jgi:hypothetical protein
VAKFKWLGRRVQKNYTLTKKFRQAHLPNSAQKSHRLEKSYKVKVKGRPITGPEGPRGEIEIELYPFVSLGTRRGWGG